MRWKEDVFVLQKDGYELNGTAGHRRIEHCDEYIVTAMKSGITEDERLIDIIMQEEKVDDIGARLRLAEFLIEYGEYIEEIKGHQIIEV